MDAIAGLLDGPRARRAFLLRCTLDPPWALHIRDEAPLSLVAMLRGRACFVLDGHEPEWLDRGDVAILLGPYCIVLAMFPRFVLTKVFDASYARDPNVLSLFASVRT